MLEFRRSFSRFVSCALPALALAACEPGDHARVTATSKGAEVTPPPSVRALPPAGDFTPGREALPGPQATTIVGWQRKGVDSVEIGLDDVARADLAERVIGVTGENPFRVATVAGEIPIARGMQPELSSELLRAPHDGAILALVVPALPAQPWVTEHLGALGARVVRMADANTYVVKASAATLRRASRDPVVYWMGRMPWSHKIDPRLARHVGLAPVAGPGDDDIEPGHAMIALYDPEDGVPMQSEIERLGLRIEDADREIGLLHVAGIDAARAASVAALPGVAFIDARRNHRIALETSVDLCGNLDWVRDTYTFGAGVTMGLIDSGFEINHDAFVGWSPLPALFALGWNVSGEGSVWDDNPSGHGTHVAGIMMSRWRGPNLVGVAPRSSGDVNHQFRVVRTGKNTGPASTVYNADQAIDILGNDNGAQVINCSWSSNNNTGTDATSVKVDAAVWLRNQVYVFAAGNDGTGAGSIDSPAAAKNAIAVGSVNNNAGRALSTFSSQGPTADSRQKPDIFAPGNSITSANAANLHGSVDMSGTSQATPHVTGFLAGLLDHYADFQRRPALAKAYTMATATRRNDLPTRTGILNGADAHFSSATTGGVWSWTDNDTRPFSYTYFDMTVPTGVTEMYVVLTWIEQEPLVGAARAVVNDVDLYVDYNRDQNGYGEWSSTSSRDNVEFVRIVNPPAGPYRIATRNYSTPNLYRSGVGVFYRK